MIIVHVGDSLMEHKQELFDIAIYMQEKCRGVPTVHISNYIHHLLLNLTLIYPVDHSLYEPGTIERGLDVNDWVCTSANFIYPGSLPLECFTVETLSHAA